MDVIWTIGCVDAIQVAAKDNMFTIGGIAIAIVVPQVSDNL